MDRQIPDENRRIVLKSSGIAFHIERVPTRSERSGEEHASTVRSAVLSSAI
jgi:hypothetical protein